MSKIISILKGRTDRKGNRIQYFLKKRLSVIRGSFHLKCFFCVMYQRGDFFYSSDFRIFFSLFFNNSLTMIQCISNSRFLLFTVFWSILCSHNWPWREGCPSDFKSFQFCIYFFSFLFFFCVVWYKSFCYQEPWVFLRLISSSN